MRQIIFILFVFTVFFSNAQISKKDSIKSLIRSSVNKADAGILFLNLSVLYEKEDVDSAIYFAKQGYKTSRSIDDKIGIAENSANLGYYYVLKNNLDSSKVNYSRAKEYFFKTDSLFKYAQSSMRVGNINLAQDNYIEALKLYQECLEISKEKNLTSLIPHLYNNIGLVYKHIEDYDDANANFREAYNLFVKNNDEANSVYPLYNIALIQSIIGKDEEAIDGYLNLVKYHLKTENWVSLGQIYNSISEIYLRNGNNDKSKEFLEMALNSINDKNDSFNTGPTSFHESSIFSNAAELYYNENNYELAKIHAYKSIELSKKNSYKLNMFKSARVLANIYDQTNKLDSSLYYYKLYTDFNRQYQDEYEVKQLTKLKMQNEFDEILKQNEIDRIYREAEYKNRELKYLALTVGAGLSIIILILLFINLKNKNAKLILKEKNLLLEKQQLNQDLDYRKKELVSNLMYLMEKNEFITSISKKLIQLKPDAKKDNKELIQQIINEIRQNSSTKIWDEFEVRFKEVHTDFYNKLSNLHLDLTPNEVKLSAFLKLNMSTKEISAITHQSIKSINMARFRLRKKLKIDRDENLISYLSSF
ncbi:tetratricopeptide repeat protein [Flavobacteriaceae bacterium]|nr:tetratricopeptide repeat protein [Flavobacteriaceae bacterium]